MTDKTNEIEYDRPGFTVDGTEFKMRDFSVIEGLDLEDYLTQIGPKRGMTRVLQESIGSEQWAVLRKLITEGKVDEDQLAAARYIAYSNFVGDVAKAPNLDELREEYNSRLESEGDSTDDSGEAPASSGS